MATPPESSSNNPPKRAARHRRAKPQPKKDDTALTPIPPPDPIAGSTSGFVGMLAKGQFGHPLGPTAGPPKENIGKYRVPMAREILPSKSPPVAPPQDRAQVPRWFRRLLPAVLLLAAVMLVIGTWAVGALLYMYRISPTIPADVHYPLLRWSPAASDLGGYTPASVVTAYTLALCLPVSLALLFILRKLSRTRNAFQ